MSKPLVFDELWEALVPLLPRERHKPKGGRPRCDDRLACMRRLRPIDFLIAAARSGAWLSCCESSPGSPGRGHCEVVFCWA